MGRPAYITDDDRLDLEGTYGKRPSKSLKRRLLVVDDNPEIRESLSLLLKLAGYDVIEAADGAHALEELAAERPDLVITDLRMPHVTGLDLIQRIRYSTEPYRRTPIVALSVHGPRELAAAAGAGADASVDKLADFDVLLGAIRRLLQ